MSLPDHRDGAAILRRFVGDDVDGFLRTAFGRHPVLHRAGADDGELPLTFDDVDELLTARSLRSPAFRLVRDGSPLPRSTYTRSGRIGGVAVDDLPDPGRVFEHVHRGATLVLQGLHRYWPPITRLCRGLEDVLTHPVQANAYLTPPASRGLEVHHDTHDVLALQLAGTKHWVVHEPAVEAPLPSQRWSADRYTPGPLVLDTVLDAGDCLYLPRGTPHAAETTTGVSLHLTVGIRPVTWVDVLRRAFARVEDEAALRASLPAGFADDPAELVAGVAARLEEAAAWLRKLDPSELTDEVVECFRTQRQPRLEGQLGRLLHAELIDDDSVVRPRDGVARLRRGGDDRTEIVTADRVVALPAGLTAAVDRLLAGAEVRVGTLAGLDAEGRCVLVRRLVREGILTVVDGPGAAHGGDPIGA